MTYLADTYFDLQWHILKGSFQLLSKSLSWHISIAKYEYTVLKL